MEVDDETHPTTQPHRRNRRKTFQISRTQNRMKILRKSQKKKNGQHTLRRDSITKNNCIDENQISTRCGNQSNILQLFQTLGRISHNLSTLLLHLKHTTPPKSLNLNQGVEEGWPKCLPLHLPLGSIYSENKRLECLCGLKGKLHVMKGNLI
jgi:hypothetical protein